MEADTESPHYRTAGAQVRHTQICGMNKFRDLQGELKSSPGVDPGRWLSPLTAAYPER